MNFFQKPFDSNTEEQKMKRTLETMKKANEVIASLKNAERPPSKEIFIKALSEIEEIKESPNLSEKTRNSLECFQKTCIQAVASILHMEGFVPFKNGDYKETADILDDLRRLIAENCETFGMEKSKLISFLTDMENDFNSARPNETISIKAINPMRIMYQEKAKSYFANDIAQIYAGMLTDAMLIPWVCNAIKK